MDDQNVKVSGVQPGDAIPMRTDSSGRLMLAEVWLLRVHHADNAPIEPGWTDVGGFRTPEGAKRALDKLTKAGRVVNDANGNAWEIKLLEVRE